MKKSWLTTFALMIVAAGGIFFLGKDMFIKYNDNQNIKKEETVKEEKLEEVVGLIKESNYVEGKQSIVIDGASGDILVHIEDKTQMAASAQLEVGKSVRIKYKKKILKSNLTEINAFSVESGEQKRLVVEGTIKEVIENGELKSIRVESEDVETIFQIDQYTKIGEDVKIEANQAVTIEHSDIFTLSEPAQGYAEAIYLQGK